jgi:SpoVK/Ycf46/Vps4 family AAA+-type ATPase
LRREVIDLLKDQHKEQQHHCADGIIKDQTKKNKKNNKKNEKNEKNNDKRKKKSSMDFDKLLVTAISTLSKKSRNRRKRRRSERGCGSVDNDDIDVEAMRNNMNRTRKYLTRLQIRKRRRCSIPNSVLSAPPFTPNNLDDLVKLARLCRTRLFRDCQLLANILKPLEQLQSLIGLKSIKDRITSMVILRLQKKTLPLPRLGHIVITGAPGTGKTTLVNILARILCGIGDLKSELVVSATKENLIAGYLGQTASKTADLVRSAFGGVLLIDEVTSLSDGRSSGSGDSFSKSCIDTLNRMLTEHSDKLLCIIAGYATEIERDFFGVNPGLRRRFGTFFNIDGYSNAELAEMATSKLDDSKLKLGEDVEFKADMFSDKKLFKDHGGSVETFISKIIVAHGRRVFGHLEKNVMSMEDLQTGIELMKEESQQKNKNDDTPPLYMYM